ncbi:hypothetical protein CMEL01_11489 [Colletotrichum melonis]|uniref:Uncharacterized protein n=1 Tax=Colletotrichum melonis TaxID=1209925 RepID=A0AAI9UZ42_9PEZI|nr:hypothetical protein CMEL01_11489 [Colletotrichum melonis]
MVQKRCLGNGTSPYPACSACLALLGRVNTWRLAGPALWGVSLCPLKQVEMQQSFRAAASIVHDATDHRWIVWSSAVSATRMNPHRPMSWKRHFERKHRQNRQTCSRRALTSVPIHGLAEPRATLREDVGVNVSSVICCSRAASLKQLVPEPCDQHRFIAGVSQPDLPRRHKVCPCSERTCTSWQGMDGFTESDCPTRMKARDRMAVDVAGSGLMRPF